MHTQDMEKTDRWELHSAVELQVTLPWANDVTLRLKQEPHALNATRMGVGACLWEGELLLAAYLATLPLHRYIGARVVELGSGPGLVGLMLAKLGAKVGACAGVGVFVALDQRLRMMVNFFHRSAMHLRLEMMWAILSF